MPFVYIQSDKKKKKKKDKSQNKIQNKRRKDKQKPFLIRAEFSKVLTILCILQAQIWTIVTLILSIKFALDSTLAIALLGFMFIGENVSIYCYFSKSRLYNATKLKTDSIKEIYKLTKDKDKALEELSEVEDMTDNAFMETLQENIKDEITIN